VVRMGISLYYGDDTGDLVAAVIADLHRQAAPATPADAAILR